MLRSVKTGEEADLYLFRKFRSHAHLGIDLACGEIVCSDLTMDDVSDPTALFDLQEARLGEHVEIIIPPKTAIINSLSD